MNQALKDRYCLFGEFRLESAERRLLRNGSALPLAPKVFDTLVLLVANAGHLVEKDEFMKELWPDAFVGEDALARNISILRKTLGESSDSQNYISTVPTRGYRFVAPVQVVPSKPSPAGNQHKGQTDGSVPSSGEKDEEQQRVSQQESVLPPKPGPVDRKTFTVDSWRSRMALLALVLAAGSGAGLITFYLLSSSHGRALTDKDTIVLADFTNTTGDRVFDGTLREGLAVQLQQSPFLSLVPEDRIQQTLRFMGQASDARLTPETAREVCQRTSSAAVLDGSIAQIGTQYLLTLKAVGCATGQSLASAQAQAIDKNHVLDALGKTASDIRNKLGESLGTVQKFDTPLEQATTPSLEALQAFSLGIRAAGTAGPAAAIPFLKRAIELDPSFALAYAYLGVGATTIGEASLGADFARKAYELRDRTSVPEKYLISAVFHKWATGDIGKGEQDCELWVQAYPRLGLPHDYLSAAVYPFTGQFEKAVDESNEVLRLNPDDAASYGLLMFHYTALNRLDKAKEAYQRALERKLDHPFIHIALNGIAFLQNDEAGISQELSWSAGKTGIEDNLLALHADTLAFYGRLKDAQATSLQAIASAKRAGKAETAATYFAVSGLREALFGNTGEAVRRAVLAIGPSAGRDAHYGAALALAFAEDRRRVQALLDDLDKKFPEDTVVQVNYLPTLRAKLALGRGNPSEAIEILRTATPYEIGLTTTSTYEWAVLYPIYVRGESYLAAHRGSEAVAEFNQILDHHMLVLNEPIGALVHLQLGRAYAMSGDFANARLAYGDFLVLWKDADPDIPVLKQAKAEYAKLHVPEHMVKVH